MVPTLLGRPLLWVNAFWVAGVLIDSGCAHTVPDLVRALESEGLRVEQLVHTHTDEDHVAGDFSLCLRFGVTPRAHPLGVERLVRPETAREMEFYRRLFWGAVKPIERAEPLSEVVEAGPYRFQVIPTPGHAAEHVVFWEEQQGWLFSGDLMLSPRLSSVRTREEPAVALESLRKLAALPVKQIFCSHARKVYTSADPLKTKLAYWEKIRQEGAALRAQGLTVAQVTRRLLGKDGFTEWITRGDVSKQNLVAGLLRGR
ncbi:MAG TPA: MBL fold metallo-hydrolase [Symbiobacteriaceae bacterium]|nr:MBL fold metallo-hydrolase [Symbiobacteriaceae bacterium]